MSKYRDRPLLQGPAPAKSRITFTTYDPEGEYRRLVILGAVISFILTMGVFW